MKKRRFRLSALLPALVATAALAMLVSCSHTHNFTNFTVLKVPTCTETGLQEAECECGVIIESEIPMAPHSGGSWETTTQVTCIAAGVKQQHCKTCGILIESVTIPATGHDFTTVEAKAATCAEDGYGEHKICTKCGYTDKDTVPALPHTPGTAATCTDPQICTVCEQIIAPAKGHKPVITPGIAATCTKEGLSDFIECETCHTVIQEQIVIPERAHTTVAVPETPPTCSAKGLSEGRICTVCGHEEVRQAIIPKLEHTFSDDADASCDVCGKMRVTGCSHPEETLEHTDPVTALCRTYGITSEVKCKKCSAILTAAEVIPAKKHVIGVIPGYPASLTRPGLTDGRKCVTCLAILVQQEVIPAGDFRSPVIDITDEEILGGGASDSVILDYNRKITEAYNSASMKITSKGTKTTSYSYGGATTESSSSVLTLSRGNWMTSSNEDGIRMDMIYADGTLYLKTTADGIVIKNKCSMLSESEIRSLLGLDFTNTILMAYKKVTFESAANGDVSFTCSGLDKDKDSVIHDMIKALESMGTVKYDDKGITGSMTIDKDCRIKTQTYSIAISSEIPYIGSVKVSSTTTDTYEYGSYEVKAPADADSYTQKNSFAELFR